MFFVVTRKPPPAGRPAEGGPTDLLLMAGADGHPTRAAAEAAAAAARRAQPDASVEVVEARGTLEAMLRAEHGGSLPALAVEQVATWEQMQAALGVRRRVFIDEQGVTEAEEIDEYDLPKAWGRTATHVLGRLGRAGLPVGTARLLLDHPPGEHAHIGRVAVLPEFRGQGYGAVLMEALHAEARRRGLPGITISAQVHAIPFYERLGYVARGPVYLDARIEHRDMDLRFGG